MPEYEYVGEHERDPKVSVAIDFIKWDRERHSPYVGIHRKPAPAFIEVKPAA